MNKYKIIYGDPAWLYRRPMKAVPYPMMDTESLKQIPVRDIADKDCVLFIWITHPKLDEVFEVIDAWGFRYTTNGFTWVKTYKNGRLFFGLGHYTRANSELCLLATKGDIHKYIKSKKVYKAQFNVSGDIAEILGDKYPDT